MIDRSLASRIKESRKSILLLGPRQVGKSTLCRALGPSSTFNLADESLYLSLLKDPGRLLRQLRAKPEPGLVLIDEIQRVPALLNSVQAYLDEGGKNRFLLTGSSARKLKRGGANLLPGRIVIEHLGPLTIWELKDRFDLKRVLDVGALPGIYTDPDEGKAVLSTYAQVYLREEIQAEALIRNVGAFARFLDVAAESSGDWINYSKLSSDLEIPKETVRRFFDILTDTLISIRIPAFVPKKSNRHVSQRDRYLFFDVGVRNAILRLVGQTLPTAELGRLFEQWFMTQIIGFSQSFQKTWDISSLRTDSGLEVDLIVDTGRTYLAIECKYSKNVGSADFRGLQFFERLAKKPVKKFVVCLTEQAEKHPSGEIVMPYDDFLLKELPEYA